MCKEKIKAYACAKGFDIRFAKASAIKHENSGAFFASPFEILNNAKTIVVLFAPYSPAGDCGAGLMHLSEYYRVSNQTYHAAKDIAAYMETLGAKAVVSPRVNAKQTALLTGGFIGKNGFYYHERFGSLVCIHTIVTDLVLYEDYTAGEQPCGGCSICEKACPTGAVKKGGGVDIKKCVRYYLNETVPETMRDEIYQLFGCEKCQSACPLNKDRRNCTPYAFELEELISGGRLNELRILAGKNMARQKRVISQAILCAGSRKTKEMLPFIEKQLNSESESVREHAEWALKRIKDEQ